MNEATSLSSSMTKIRTSELHPSERVVTILRQPGAEFSASAFGSVTAGGFGCVAAGLRLVKFRASSRVSL